MYVVGTKPTIGATERFVNSQSVFVQKPVVLYHSNGYFVIRFDNEEDRNNAPDHITY